MRTKAEPTTIPGGPRRTTLPHPRRGTAGPQQAPAGDIPVDSRAGRTDGSESSELREVMELGRGGMGTVSLVLDSEGRTFARKKLLPELAREPEKRELFLREARVAKGLAHPNVVRTYRAGLEDGEPYLVMAFVDGLPLDRLLSLSREAGLPLPRKLAAHLVACLAAGLHAAHELEDEDGTPLNLVHRDISPHNVMVSREGDVFLLDFGVAKIDALRGLTKTGEVRGKTAYMSPEQGLGDTLDRRSDLFSLGAILYECVQGARMWGDGTELDVLRKLALETPPSLDGDDALSEVHASLVAKEPERRPDTARVAEQALVHYARSDGEAEAERTKRARHELAAWVLQIAKDELLDRQKTLSEAIAPVRASLPPPSSAKGSASVPRTSGGKDAPSFSDTSGIVAKAYTSERQPSRRGSVVAIALVCGLAGAIAVAATRPNAEPRSSNVTSPPPPPSTTSTTTSPMASSHGADPPAPSVTAAVPSSGPSGRAPAKPVVVGPPAVSAAPKSVPSTPVPTVSASAPPVTSASSKPVPLNVDPTPF